MASLNINSQEEDYQSRGKLTRLSLLPFNFRSMSMFQCGWMCCLCPSPHIYSTTWIHTALVLRAQAGFFPLHLWSEVQCGLMDSAGGGLPSSTCSAQVPRCSGCLVELSMELIWVKLIRRTQLFGPWGRADAGRCSEVIILQNCLCRQKCEGHSAEPNQKYETTRQVL